MAACDGVRWARLLPGALLVSVALLQIVLARTASLSPWSGGGFGMFSSTDAGPTRHLHAFVERPGILREVEVPEALADSLERALTLPTEHRLQQLGRALAALPSPDQGAPTRVRLQVWRRSYDRESLAPAAELLRAVEVELHGP